MAANDTSRPINTPVPKKIIVPIQNKVCFGRMCVKYVNAKKQTRTLPSSLK